MPKNDKHPKLGHLPEIESFATHIAYLNEGRLEFVEEMSACSELFREIEITLDAPAAVVADLPAAWLNAEHSGTVVRFTDSTYESGRTHAEIRRRFTGVLDITARSMTLRAIFIALAKSARSKS